MPRVQDAHQLASSQSTSVQRRMQLSHLRRLLGMVPQAFTRTRESFVSDATKEDT